MGFSKNPHWRISLSFIYMSLIELLKHQNIILIISGILINAQWFPFNWTPHIQKVITHSRHLIWSVTTDLYLLKPQEVRSSCFLLELIEQVHFRGRMKTRFQGRRKNWKEPEPAGWPQKETSVVSGVRTPPGVHQHNRFRQHGPACSPVPCLGVLSVEHLQGWRAHYRRKKGTLYNLGKSLLLSKPPFSHLPNGRNRVWST